MKNSGRNRDGDLADCFLGKEMFMKSRRKKQQPSQNAPSPELVLQKAIALADASSPDMALALLNHSRSQVDFLKNARGVCLLRVGDIEGAVHLFRSLVLASGCTWMKTESPVIQRTNMCTALLISGRVSGCVQLLSEIPEQQHPSVVRLRQTLESWHAGLSRLQRIQWFFGLNPGVPVPLHGLPGDFVDPELLTPLTSSQPSVRSRPTIHAA